MATQETLNQVQQLYVAYYGRPADAEGLAFWADALEANGGDTSVIIDDFGNSAEFEARFGEMSNEELVNNLYQQLFGRDADDEGLTFYTGHLESGDLSLAQIASEIAGGAQDNEDGHNDLTTLNNKVAAANLYTAATEGQHDGTDADNYAADWLATVNADTDVDTIDMDEVVANLPEPSEPVEPEEPADTDPVNFISLTAGTDRLTGTDENDKFEAYLSQSEYTGGVSNTLSSADHLDGGAGYDSLFAELTSEFRGAGAGALQVQPRTTSIEQVEIESRDGYNALDAKHMYGVERIGSKQSDGSLQIDNLTTLANDGVTKRNTSDLTITMDHTANTNSTGLASDLTVYFDDNYLISGEQSEFSIQLRIVNNFQLAENDAPLSGFQTVNFAVGDQQVVVDITDATTYQQVANAINAELSAQGISGVHAAPAPERTSIFSDDVPAGAGYEQGQLAGVYSPVNIVSTTEPLSNGPIELESNIENFDGLNTWVDGDSTITDDPISVNIELTKVGRGGIGGDLLVGAKSMAQGIEEFNVTVMGEDHLPNNLGTLSTTASGLSTVNIASEAGLDSYASLEIRSGFGQNSLELVDASAFLGDLTLGSSLAIANLDTLIATGGGDVDYDGISIGGHDTSITTGAGNDTINVDLFGVSNSGSTPSSAVINAGDGNNEVVVESFGAGAHTAIITTGSGDDVILGNGVSITANTGAGNDVVYVDNTGDKGDALVSTANLQQTDGSGNVSYSFMYGRTVTVTVDGDQGINNAVAQAFNSGFEGQATVTAGSNSRLTTKQDLNNAVLEAVANSQVLSALVEVSVDSHGELVFTSLVGGDNITVEIGLGESDWSDNDVTTLQNEYRAANGDSELTISDSYGEVFTDAQLLEGGSDSTAVNNNTVILGGGVDTVVLSTQAQASDTIVIDQAFGTAHVVNFTVGQDNLDFSAFLTSQRSPSGSEDSRQTIAGDFLATGTTLRANDVNVQTFSGNDDVESFADLNASNLLDVFNFSTQSYTNTSSTVNLVNGDGNAIVMVQNDENAGEYKVFHVTFNGTDADFELSASNIQELGTLDFGADIFDSADPADPVDPVDPVDPEDPTFDEVIVVENLANYDAADADVLFQFTEGNGSTQAVIANFSAGDALDLPEGVEGTIDIAASGTSQIDFFFGEFGSDNWLLNFTEVDSQVVADVAAADDVDAALAVLNDAWGDWLI